MRITRSVPQELKRQSLNVRWIPKDGPTVHNSGYGGHSHGGEHLYLFTVVWCFDPPFYMMRADSTEEALEAINIVFGGYEKGYKEEEIAGVVFDEKHVENEHQGAWRAVYGPDDIRIWEIA